MDTKKPKDIPEPLKGFPVPLLRQSNGRPSTSFTIAFLAFNVVLLWLLLSIFEGFGSLKIRPFSAAEAMGFLSPCFLLYFGNKRTDSQVKE